MWTSSPTIKDASTHLEVAEKDDVDTTSNEQHPLTPTPARAIHNIPSEEGQGGSPIESMLSQHSKMHPPPKSVCTSTILRQSILVDNLKTPAWQKRVHAYGLLSRQPSSPSPNIFVCDSSISPIRGQESHELSEQSLHGNNLKDLQERLLTITRNSSYVDSNDDEEFQETSLESRVTSGHSIETPFFREEQMAWSESSEDVLWCDDKQGLLLGLALFISTTILVILLLFVIKLLADKYDGS